MILTTSISKWGNGQGIRIPKNILEFLKWTESEKVEIIAENDGIKIKKIKRNYKYIQKKHIKELFEDFNEIYKKENIDWGEPVGKEIW